MAPRSGRRSVTGVVALTAVVLGAFAAPAAAEARNVTVGCWNDYGGEYSWALVKKPRRCFWNGDEVHARQVPIRKMRWRSWGGKTACGRGTFFYNQGYRARARFCLYSLGQWEDGIWTYNRIRGVIYNPGHPVRFRTSTL